MEIGKVLQAVGDKKRMDYGGWMGIMDIVEMLKAMGDEIRLRILNLLYKQTLCVCDLEEILNISQSNASRHISMLRRTGLVTGQKQAQWIFYRVDENVLEQHEFVQKFLDTELDKNKQCVKDMERMKTYRQTGGGCQRTIRAEGG